mgnify:CR=1 FL=1
MKRRTVAILLIVCFVMAVMLCGCSEASKVNSNISKQADYLV